MTRYPLAVLTAFRTAVPIAVAWFGLSIAPSPVSAAASAEELGAVSLMRAPVACAPCSADVQHITFRSARPGRHVGQLTEARKFVVRPAARRARPARSGGGTALP
ncbi:hypothetical protein CC85DRAFT_51594 [Cutaneotrichosporon oleaginosum]|uniref:Uncharacterized protein n=1 Tax=Cutaneotrichosporon oleaginosum TaxID=879819 RepID=A0A0J0XQL0_9TREE|nr:uncharacterized protein CC85DRAFT_51594 [Cutaneotrichosporon oleaginosum]KLT43377.1 hypothetical protein CC85DRAFT_51594 [Cutaneotrichosporon oleaginosum]TXT05409.1 hypothetical protein COLE_06729 [Cutaneotrichosporon oleaginosum]